MSSFAMILRRRGDRVLQLQRRLHHLVQHAVDAVADAEVLLVRLDVDVAGALLDRVEQDRRCTSLTTGASRRPLLELDDVDARRRRRRARRRRRRSSPIIVVVGRACLS